MLSRSWLRLALVPAVLVLVCAASAAGAFTLDQVLSYSYLSDLTAAEHGGRIAWVREVNGVRNVWIADAPSFKARQVTHYTADDGQEITQLNFSPDGRHLVYVRGGDHDANWQLSYAPDPTASPKEQKVAIWAVSYAGAAPHEVAEGDAPAVTDDGRVAYLKDGQVWLARLDGKAKPARLFFDMGKDRDLKWSPDGKALAYVSVRGEHSFIGVYRDQDRPLLYLSPSTYQDVSPRWSADGTQIAFARRQSNGGPPRPILKETPEPWSIWVADASSGAGHRVWQSPNTLDGSWPDTEGEANLHWAAKGRLVFLADLDGWPHLYSVSAQGGEPLLLTPGKFMVEHVAESPDGTAMIFDANTGPSPDDSDRRHVFCVPVDKAQPFALTSGGAMQIAPIATSDTAVAYLEAGPKHPFMTGMVGLDGSGAHTLAGQSLPPDFPAAELVTPKLVTFTAADGTVVQGQLFDSGEGSVPKPGIVFVHGGPPRQMLLGWHYMDYYSNSYAVNQYLAAHGFVVLSVNYRLGIGYGRVFHHPEHAGPAGASEYQDVVAGARYLQHVPGVDANRIGIWGGSYGGYLTALALARNSDIFKAGADMHGIHDWSRFLSDWFGRAPPRYEKGDREEALKVAFDSSPDASIATWKSPVLLIQGDDDRNVHFDQMVDVVPRLTAHHVPFEELVLPDEIHGFLRHASWRKADAATVAFFQKKFGVL